MNITKYEHACLILEIDGKKLAIDPGIFTKSLKDYSNILAVVITHEHQDHLDQNQLDNIKSANPEVVVYGPESVIERVENLKTQVVKPGEEYNVGPFKLNFNGGRHAIIHSSIPQIENVGVMVNDSLYYPGDSFTLPDKDVQVLAVPASAPWMKAAEAMDYISQAKTKIIFPTHDGLLSQAGVNINTNILGSTAASAGAEYKSLVPGSSITV